MTEVRLITRSCDTLESLERISSWIPSAKYKSSLLPLKLSNGKTAMLFSPGLPMTRCRCRNDTRGSVLPASQQKESFRKSRTRTNSTAFDRCAQTAVLAAVHANEFHPIRDDRMARPDTVSGRRSHWPG